jgi:hypothetical protein
MKPDLHEQALEAVRKWWNAWAERDLETVKGMLDPTYSEQGEIAGIRLPSSREIGRLIEEAQQQSADVSITHWEIYDTVTRLFDSTAVCSYAFHISGRRGRRSFTFEGRATDVLSLKEGQWTFVSHRGTLDRR